METVLSKRVFADGSGAPALIEVSGWWFAFNLLGAGNVTCHFDVAPDSKGDLLRVYPSMCRARVRAFARAVYEREVVSRLSREWIAKNAEMYS